MPAKKRRKGAIELSLGFIVAVVFAVVLLSLAIVWLQGFFLQLPGLTDDLIQQSQTKIQETFQQTQSNFAIWPSRYDLTRGKELKMSAGIKNDASDSADHTFVINVIPAAASDEVCSGGDITACPNVESEMEKWLSWDKQQSVIQKNRVGYKTISIKPSSSAKAGTYIFSVVACEGVGSYSACTRETLNWGGSAQELALTLK
jgi:cytoskeletal protein RodZ